MTEGNEFTVDWKVSISEDGTGFTWTAEGKPSTDKRRKVKADATQIFADRLSALANARSVLEERTNAMRQQNAYGDLEEAEFTL